MFKKLINRSEGSQVEMNDSALRDIIPSNDVDITKKPRRKRFSNICKILILIFFLGLVAIGIVILALFLGYSGKSFMNFIIQSSKGNLFSSSSSSSNKTHARIFHQESLTSDEQTWKKVTVIPSNNNQQVHISSSRMTTEEDNKYISTNTPFMKSYASSNTIVNEQSTSTISPYVTIKNQEYVHTSSENEITTTIDIITSTFFIQKLRNPEITTSKKIPITTQINFQTSTNENKKKIIFTKHKNLDEDDTIDDLLFS